MALGTPLRCVMVDHRCVAMCCGFGTPVWSWCTLYLRSMASCTTTSTAALMAANGPRRTTRRVGLPVASSARRAYTVSGRVFVVGSLDCADQSVSDCWFSDDGLQTWSHMLNFSAPSLSFSPKLWLCTNFDPSICGFLHSTCPKRTPWLRQRRLSHSHLQQPKRGTLWTRLQPQV